MSRNSLSGLSKHVSVLSAGLTGGIAFVYRVATSDAVRHALTAAGDAFRLLAIFFGNGIKQILGEAFPGLWKVWTVGIVGGTRQFVGQFNNNNGEAAIQSARNTFKPVGYVLLIASVLLTIVIPLIGVAVFLGTFIVFFRPVENLPLDSFLADTGLYNGLGIGTALILNLFRAFGAFRAACRWVYSQFK